MTAGRSLPSGAPRWGSVRGTRGGRSAKAPMADSRARPVPRPCRERTGTQPVRRPYDLRPCRAVAVAGLRRPARRTRCPRRAQRACPAHHLRPRHSRLRPDRQPAHRASPPPQPWPPDGPQQSAQPPGIPSVMRPCHSWTQRDTAGPETSAQIRLHACDLRKSRPRRSAPWITAPYGRSRAPVLHKPLTSPDLAHHWPTATGNGLQNRSRIRIRPGIREHRHRA